ncbi:hypothetical protein L278_12105 [Mannheimia haemolytica D35]|nr:hypothetical protein L278_12105 [Mannheimia haemolytica D35]
MELKKHLQIFPKKTTACILEPSFLSDNKLSFSVSFLPLPQQQKTACISTGGSLGLLVLCLFVLILLLLKFSLL